MAALEHAQKIFKAIVKGKEPPTLNNSFRLRNGETKTYEILHPVLHFHTFPYPPQILVRSCYRRIWTHLKKEMDFRKRASDYASSSSPDDVNPFTEGMPSNGLVLWGPGIGKTICIHYLLGRALSAGYTVTLKVHIDGSCFFFGKDGVVQLRQGTVHPASDLILADNIGTLKGVGTDGATMVVYATSPKAPSYTTWAKVTERIEEWCIPLVAEVEMEAIDAFTINLPEDHYKPMELFPIFSGSARLCCGKYVKRGNGNPMVDVTVPTLNLNLANVVKIQPDDLHLQDDFSRFFYVTLKENFEETSPVPFGTGKLRASFTYEIPTQYLRKIFILLLAKAELAAQIAVCKLFSPIHTICGPAYEVYVLKRLTMSFEGTITPIFPYTPQTHTPPLIWPGASDATARRYFDGDMSQISFQHDRVMWVPPERFPTMDAILIENGTSQRPKITIIQVTIARDHDIKPVGIAKLFKHIRDTLRKPLTSIEWQFLFIVPTDSVGESLCSGRPEHNQLTPAAVPEPSETVEPGSKKRKLSSKPKVPSTRTKVCIPIGYAKVSFLEDDPENESLWAEIGSTFSFKTEQEVQEEGLKTTVTHTEGDFTVMRKESQFLVNDDDDS